MNAPFQDAFGQLVAAVEDRVHDVAGAVVGVAAEGVLEEVVRLLGGRDHVVGFGGRRREGLSLDPERRARIGRRNDRQELAVVGAPVQGVVDAGQPVDDLARVRVDVDELAHVDVVAHFDLPDEVVRAGHAPDQTRAVDHEKPRARGQRRGVRHALRSRCGWLPRRRPSPPSEGVTLRSRSGISVPLTAVSAAGGVEVRPQGRPEDRHAAM